MIAQQFAQDRLRSKCTPNELAVLKLEKNFEGVNVYEVRGTDCLRFDQFQEEIIQGVFQSLFVYKLYGREDYDEQLRQDGFEGFSLKQMPLAENAFCTMYKE